MVIINVSLSLFHVPSCPPGPLSGPPIQIIPDYRAREGGSDVDKSAKQPELELEEEEEEEDRAFATVIEDAGIGDSIGTLCSMNGSVCCACGLVISADMNEC